LRGHMLTNVHRSQLDRHLMSRRELPEHYGIGMALVAGAGAIVFGLLAAFGPEAKELRMVAERT
jgi:hypothetical protein